MKELYIAVSSAAAQERKLEIISNNLANINTPGYKKDNIVFHSMLADSLMPASISRDTSPGALYRDTMVSSVFSEIGATRTDFGSGTLRMTGNKTDLAIQGDGFFAVRTPEGTRYTRNGAMILNSKGELAIDEERVLLNTGNSPISLTSPDFEVSPNGDIMADGAVVDTIKVVTFDDKSQLRKMGHSEFAPADETVTAVDAEDFSVIQEHVELSNVEPIQEMIEMIALQRGYQAYEKAIQTSDELAQKRIAQAL